MADMIGYVQPMIQYQARSHLDGYEFPIGNNRLIMLNCTIPWDAAAAWPTAMWQGTIVMLLDAGCALLFAIQHRRRRRAAVFATWLIMLVALIISLLGISRQVTAGKAKHTEAAAMVESYNNRDMPANREALMNMLVALYPITSSWSYNMPHWAWHGWASAVTVWLFLVAPIGAMLAHVLRTVHVGGKHRDAKATPLFQTLIASPGVSGEEVATMRMECGKACEMTISSTSTSTGQYNGGFFLG